MNDPLKLTHSARSPPPPPQPPPPPLYPAPSGGSPQAAMLHHRNVSHSGAHNFQQSQHSGTSVQGATTATTSVAVAGGSGKISSSYEILSKNSKKGDKIQRTSTDTSSSEVISFDFPADEFTPAGTYYSSYDHEEAGGRHSHLWNHSIHSSYTQDLHPASNYHYSTQRRKLTLANCWRQLQSLLRSDDVKKLLLSLLYFFAVMLFLSCLLVVVHLRLPDPLKYAHPLPDVILDTVPRVLWGLQVAESLITLLGVILLILIVFHKHGLVLARRVLAIIATIFFYRGLSVLSTQLPQSNEDLFVICTPIQYSGVADFLRRAGSILLGMGLRINGGQTCGDYVFSGHTVSLTVFQLFLVYYTPCSRPFWVLKVLALVGNFLGMFFILAAHEHYTVDVIIAFVISLLVFNDYHNIANHPELRQRDKFRLLLTSPMTFALEKHTEEAVVNRIRVPFLKTWRRFRGLSRLRRHTDDLSD